MPKKIAIFFLAFYLICSMLGCLRRRFPVVKESTGQSRYAIAKERAENYFIKARDYDRRNVQQMAEHYYESAFEHDPKSKVLKELLVGKYIASKKYKKALVLIKGNRKLEKLSDGEKRNVSSLYLEMGQYNKAIEVLESIKKIGLLERRTLGYLYEHILNYKEAVKNYSIYLEAKPESVNLGLKLAELYIKEEFYDKAESLYVSLEEKGNNKIAVVNGLAALYLIKTDTASAINLYKTAIVLDSSSSDALTNLSQIYIAQGDFTSAISYYEKLSHNDYLTTFYHKKALAMLYYYNSEYEKASKILQELLSDNNSDYELHFYLGLIFASDNKISSAEMEFRKSLAIRNTYKDAWLQLCYLALKQKDWDKALENALQFKENLPRSGAAWRMHGYILNVQKKYKMAIEVLKKSLTFESINAAVWFELGSAYERTGDFNKAEDAFSRALQIDPDDDATANYLGYMWAEQNKHLDSAGVLLEFALKKKPKNGAYLDSYAWIFYKLGDYDSAEKYIYKALEHITDDPIVYDHLGDILSKKKKYQNAINAYLKCIALENEKKAEIQKKIDSLKKYLKKSVPEKKY